MKAENIENNKENNDNSDEEVFYEEELEKIINANNAISEEDLQAINLSSPNPNISQFQEFQPDEKDDNVKKNLLLDEAIPVEYEDIPYQLFIYLKEEKEKLLCFELIPKEGHLPYSYRNIMNEKSFYAINSIFKELKTIENIGKKIIGLFNKKRASLAKDSKEDRFYLILKVTIIDEDKEILIHLNKNESIQVSTINYLLREAKEIKKDFIKSKSEIKNRIKKELKDISVLKKTNIENVNIINDIKNKVNKDKEDEISDDENEYNYKNEKKANVKEQNKDNKDDNKIDIDDDSLLRIGQMIIEQNEEYKNLGNRIKKIENDFDLLINNFKCEIGPQNVILNLSINHIDPYILIHFEIENVGKYALTSMNDDIFCSIEGISPEMISFINSSEKYIYLNQNLLPKQKINICKKIILNNPTVNTKYEFYINIFTLNHGKISINPIKIIIYIKSSEQNEENFISFLNNKILDFDIKNKKIIFEYFEEVSKKNENNNEIDVGIGHKKKRIKIYKYLYDDKSGMAENKNGIKDKIDAFVIINKDDIDKIRRKICDRYEGCKKIEKYKIEDIICSCAGDFQKICEILNNNDI